MRRWSSFTVRQISTMRSRTITIAMPDTNSPTTPKRTRIQKYRLCTFSMFEVKNRMCTVSFHSG